MKALVTGATGFIGSHLTEKLIEQGYAVTCLVRKTSNRRWIEGLDINIVFGDCEDEESLAGIPQDMDYVFHLAGLTKAKKDEDLYCANVKGTENLIRAVLTRTPALKKFVFMSSLAAAGPSMDGLSVNEDSEAHPVSNYGKSKLQAERIVTGQDKTLPATILRPPAVYGPRDRDFYVLFKMLKKGFYPDWGKCYYSMLYVDDLVNGIIAAAEAEDAAGKTYFLTDGRIYNSIELVSEIAKALDRRVLRIRIPKPVMTAITNISERLGDRVSIINRDKLRELKHTHWICDSSKAERELGFMPKVHIKEGMKWTADWYRINQWL